MEEEYKSKICFSCINKVCTGNIVKKQKRKYNNNKM
nr:MAG TPA: hypothetical protein [Caudoviricetes sp.]